MFKVGRTGLLVALLLLPIIALPQENLSQEQPGPVQALEDRKGKEGVDVHGSNSDADANRAALAPEVVVKPGFRPSGGQPGEEEQRRDGKEREDRQLNLDLAQSNVVAQESLADTGIFMRWFVGIQTVLSVVAVFLLGHTLIWTRRASESARRAADASDQAVQATMQAVKVSSDTAMRELRAYLIIEEAHLSAIEDSRERFSFQVILNVRNVGKTPAKAVRTKFNISDDGRQTDHSKSSYTDPNSKGRDVGPSQQLMQYCYGRSMRRDRLRALKETANELFIWGAIEYQDIYGQDRRTTYFYRWNVTNFVSASDGNEIQ